MISNKTYDILKWVAILLLPALSALVGTVGAAVSFEYTEIAVIVINAIAVFIGSVIKVSTDKYNKIDE
ncbi:phage holin [Miniphocaeibacter massiliensis]|uniref:phage holin n=1 Tax=Miniphocaeibacter massiliensis TaxID=2041841 RepID=UPI000C1B9B7E|nr:phage holin [Miniphocaeibacter massiliensis]